MFQTPSSAALSSETFDEPQGIIRVSLGETPASGYFTIRFHPFDCYPAMSDKPYFEQHVFFCMNQRDDNTRPCCAAQGAQAAQKHAKKRIKQLGLNNDGNVRINQAGCLDRCEEGPVLVIYPQGVWYTYVDNSDIDDIIDTHLVGGEIVERLKI